jgi:hypothetical protein
LPFTVTLMGAPAGASTCSVAQRLLGKHPAGHVAGLREGADATGSNTEPHLAGSAATWIFTD